MKRAAVFALFACMVAIGVVYAVTFLARTPPLWSVWLFVVAISVSMVATMIIGATRTDGRLGLLVIPFILTLAIVLGGFSLVLLLPAASEPLWLGLPRRAAIVIYGIGLLPLLILPIAYALTFDDSNLSAEDLKSIGELGAVRIPSPSDSE